MLILIIGLIILAGIAMTVGVLHNRQIQKKIESGELKAAPEIVEADAECCGQHEICEKESLLAAERKTVFNYGDVIQFLFSGFAVIFVEGLSKAVVYGIQGYDKRSVSEPARSEEHTS